MTKVIKNCLINNNLRIITILKEKTEGTNPSLMVRLFCTLTVQSMEEIMVLVNHSNEISLVELKLSATVEPPCTTTSRKPPLPLTDQLTKTPSQSITV